MLFKQGTKTEIRARHILVKTRDEAVSLIEKLKAGQDFGELAIKYSTDPAGKNGGDLGYFGKGMMVPEFEKAAFALQAGEFTRQPIETQFGWHLILKEDERNAAPPDFDRVKDKVRQVILREEYDKLVQASRESDSVEILDKKLESDLLAAGALTSR